MDNRQSNQDRERIVHQRLIEVQSYLHAFVYSLLGSGEDAYDVLQEANLAIIAKATEYDSDRSFFTWACRFAQLQVMAYRKRQGRDRLWFDDELVGVLAEDFGAGLQEPSTRMDALSKCLDGLEPSHRFLISQRYEYGNATADIAAALGKGVGAIRARIFRIRKQLAECIQRRVASEALQ